VFFGKGVLAPGPYGQVLIQIAQDTGWDREIRPTILMGFTYVISAKSPDALKAGKPRIRNLKKAGEQKMAEEIKKESGQEEQSTVETPLEEMTVKELRDMAKNIPELSGVSAMKKDELLAALGKQQAKEGKKDEETSPEKPLDKMTAKELREIALEIPGVTGVHAMKKEQLLDVIKEYKGIEDEGPAKKTKTKRVKPTANVKGLKEKISRLREEQQTARESKNRKKVDLFRRRINRLKKQTRKVAQG
jgi:hypothetical protein